MVMCMVTMDIEFSDVAAQKYLNALKSNVIVLLHLECSAP